jgi:hypothetical protein
VGPFSVYVPPTNSQTGFNDDWGFQEGWRHRGGGYSGISDVTKEDYLSKATNVCSLS